MIDWKSKPVLIGGGVAFFAVVLIAAGGSKKSSSANYMTTGPSPAELASQTNLALAQISAGVEQSKINAGLSAVQIQSQGELATSTLAADLERYKTDAGAAAQARSDQLNANIASAQISATVHGLDATAAVQKYTLDQAYAMQVSNNNFQLDQAQVASQSTITLANIASLIAGKQIDSNAAITHDALQAGIVRDTLNANLMRDINNSNNAAQVSVVTSSYTAATEQARIAGNVSTHLSDNNASASKHSSTMGVVGSVLGGILSIFSDSRLKTDAKLVAMTDDGIGIYSYRYRDSKETVLGVMADEVAVMQPFALGRKIGGYQTVNYAV